MQLNVIGYVYAISVIKKKKKKLSSQRLQTSAIGRLRSCNFTKTQKVIYRDECGTVSREN